MKFWFGEKHIDWRMWGVTVKTKTRWWFIGVSVALQEKQS